MLLGRLPGIEVVGAAVDGEEALAMAGRLRPDVILMDLRMPRCDGVEAIRRLRDERHPAPVIALTTYADDRSVLDALRAGARGFLTKDAGAADIERALHAVLAGGAALDPAVQHHLVDALSPGPADADVPMPRGPLPDGLTRREAEVLALIAARLAVGPSPERDCPLWTRPAGAGPWGAGGPPAAVAPRAGDCPVWTRPTSESVAAVAGRELGQARL
jgi:DNA-binding NarL/FixJ family response regulator